MNEEEKKAIEILDTFELRRKTINYKNISLEDVQSVKIVLKLIEKQQKEIEVLREENFDAVYIKAVADFKDKIREKIKELEQIQNTALTETTIEIMDYKITILKQLLEE